MVHRREWSHGLRDFNAKFWTSFRLQETTSKGIPRDPETDTHQLLLLLVLLPVLIVASTISTTSATKNTTSGTAS